MKLGDLEINDLSKKIKKENIFVGNIKKCTKYRKVDINKNKGANSYVVYNSEVYANDIILVKISNNPVEYIILSTFEVIIDYLKENNLNELNDKFFEEQVFGIKAKGLGSTWVDNNSVKPYYKNEKGKIKIKKIKKI